MGKTAKGAVWLCEDMLSPYDYWQFWRNTHDDDLKRFLLLFTDENEDTIDLICKQDINLAKEKLANDATEICHGKDAALKAYSTAKETFSANKGSGDMLPKFYFKEVEVLSAPIFRFFVLCKLCASGSEARKLIQNGGARLNNIKINSELQSFSKKDFSNENQIKLSAGKKKHAILRIKSNESNLS